MSPETLPFTLRLASEKDLPQLKQMYVKTISEACTNDYSASQIKAWAASAQKEERWREAVTTQYFQVAEHSRQIIGFASLKENTYIDFIYVHPGFLRRGIADSLFRVLLAEAERNGTRILTSDVSKTARPFFEKKGFKVVRENKNKHRERNI